MNTMRDAILESEVISISASSKSAVRRSSLSKVCSFRTRASLAQLVQFPTERKCEVAERLLTVFRRYDDDIVQRYFWSTDFAHDLLCLCEHAKNTLRQESAYFELNGPVHVFGDVHGNLEDLFFFRDKLWPAGMDVTAGKFLFLGDYVDRGIKGLEVLTYLFSSKVVSPNKIFMLRGNHELRYVNGWEAHYGERSFLWQCKDRFGDHLGDKVWRACNSVFDHLPLACSIDKTVFCSHGGIPRSRHTRQDASGYRGNTEVDTRLDDISSINLPAKIAPQRFTVDLDSSDTEEDEVPEGLQPWQTSVAMDIMWGDPCPSNVDIDCEAGEQESPLLDNLGFGPGQRGGAAIMFGQRAIDEFLESNGFSVMIRAHQASAAGINVTKNGKVITVFSTSKDHALGDTSSCAYILVEDMRLTAVNRSIDSSSLQTQRNAKRVSQSKLNKSHGQGSARDQVPLHQSRQVSGNSSNSAASHAA